VFEHIEPPIRTAFRNLYRLLNYGGVCIFTVPYILHGEMQEHFPDLFDYRINKKALINETEEGKEQVYKDLRFHGGHGQTLEMRVFTKKALLRMLSEAGFKDIEFHKIEKPKYGILWNENSQALPVTMRG
jgi:hypothetical protein